MNNIVIIFEGEKPDLSEFVEIGTNGTVHKWNQLNGMSHVIGERIDDALYNGILNDNEIYVCLVNNVVLPEMTLEYKTHTAQNPLFTARVDQQGRISIWKQIRDKEGIKPGDMVDVFHMKTVE